MRLRHLLALVALSTLIACGEDDPTQIQDPDPVGGDTIPTPEELCTEAGEEAYVLQCAAESVIDDDGGTVTLAADEGEGWVEMSTYVPAGAKPESLEYFSLVMQRVDAAAYFEATGQKCIRGTERDFDAPMFGDCLRVTTRPELPEALLAPAVIEMCIDPYGLEGIKFDEEQEDRLQILRAEDGETQGLPNVDAPGCTVPMPSPAVLGFLPVPESGVLRHAAVAVNTVVRWVAPRPVAAHGTIRLAGSTSVFSLFRWGLPGAMVPESEQSIVIQQLEDGSESYEVPVEVRVVDSGSERPAPSQVEGATVTFVGTSDPDRVVTGADGLAATTWTVSDVPGTHVLQASALGLNALEVPDHDDLIDFTPSTLDFTATVVGPPSAAVQLPAPDQPLTGAVGASVSDTLRITVTDGEGGAVAGWPVRWTTTCDAESPSDCDGFVEGDSLTGPDGTASGVWTLATTPGDNEASVSVGSEAFGFTAATWTASSYTCDGVTVDGVMGEREWDCAAGSARSFMAASPDGETPAEVWFEQDADNIYLLVRVQRPALDGESSLHVEFDNTLNGATADDDVLGLYTVEGGGHVFVDQYLTEPCVTNWDGMLFGCGVPDVDAGGSNDGSGAVANDGTWTTFEIVHPREGDAGLDLTLSEENPLVRFFITVRVGERYEDRTKWPGYRLYRRIRFDPGA